MRRFHWPWVSRKRYLTELLDERGAVWVAVGRARAAERQMQAMRVMFERQLERLIRVQAVQGLPRGRFAVPVLIDSPLVAELSGKLPLQQQIDFIAVRAGQYVENYLKARPDLFSQLPEKEREL